MITNKKFTGNNVVDKRSPSRQMRPITLSLCRAIQHDHRSRPMGDPALDKWEHDQTENI